MRLEENFVASQALKSLNNDNQVPEDDSEKKLRQYVKSAVITKDPVKRVFRFDNERVSDHLM